MDRNDYLRPTTYGHRTQYDILSHVLRSGREISIHEHDRQMPPSQSIANTRGTAGYDMSQKCRWSCYPSEEDKLYHLRHLNRQVPVNTVRLVVPISPITCSLEPLLAKPHKVAHDPNARKCQQPRSHPRTWDSAKYGDAERGKTKSKTHDQIRNEQLALQSEARMIPYPYSHHSCYPQKSPIRASYSISLHFVPPPPHDNTLPVLVEAAPLGLLLHLLGHLERLLLLLHLAHLGEHHLAEDGTLELLG